MLTEMVVRYGADLGGLISGSLRAARQMQQFGDTASSTMQQVSVSEARAAEAAKKVALAEAQAAQAIKKASDLANNGKASAEQIAVAQARAAVAAEKVTVAEARAAQAMAKAQQEAQALATAATTTAASETRLSSASQVASSALRGMHTSTRNVMGSIVEFGSKLGMTIFGLKELASGVLEFGQGLLAPNAAMEQSRVSFNAFLGSAKETDVFLRGLGQFAATTPYEFSDARQGALNILNMGKSSQQVIPYLNNIGNAVAKVGGSGETFRDVSAIIAQMGIKGKVTTEEMMQLSERNIPAFQILAGAMKIPVSELQNMITKGQLGKDKIDLLVSAMGQFGNGAMVAQGQTFNGLLSTFSDNIQMALMSFTGPLFDMAKNALVELGNLVSGQSFQNFAKNLGENLGTSLTTAVNFISTQVIPTVQNMATAFQQVTQSQEFGAFVASVQILAQVISMTLGPAIQPVAIALQSMFSNQQISTNATILTAVFGGLATAINWVSGIIAQIPAAIDTANSVLQPLGAWLVATFKPAWDQLVTTIQTQLLPAWQQLVIGIQPALPALQMLGGVILGVLVVALGIFLSAVVAVVQGVATALPGLIRMFGGLVQFISGALQVAGGIVAFFVDLVSGNFGRLGGDIQVIFGGIARMIEGTWNWIAGIFQFGIGLAVGYVSGFISTIVAFFTSLYNILVGHSIVPDMVNGIINSFLSLGQRGISAVTSLITGITGLFTNLSSQAFSFGSNMVQGLINGITSMVGAAGSAAQSIINTVASYIGFHSPAEKGQGRYIEDFGRNMVSGFLDGVESGMPTVHTTMDHFIQKPDSVRQSLDANGSRRPATIIINMDSREMRRLFLQDVRDEIIIEAGWR